MPPKGNKSLSSTMSPQQAIPLLRRQIERLDAILDVPFHDPAVEAWESTTLAILNSVYGMPDGNLHPNTSAVIHAESTQPEFSEMSHIEAEYVQTEEPTLRELAMAAAEQRYFEVRQQKRRYLLESYVEQLQDLPQPATAGPLASTGSILKSRA
jgi:hypothetical protein